MGVLVGNLNHMNIYLEKVGTAVTFTIEIGIQTKILSLSDMEKIVQSNKLTFKDLSTEKAVIDYLKRQGFLADNLSELKEMLTLEIPQEAPEQVFPSVAPPEEFKFSTIVPESLDGASVNIDNGFVFEGEAKAPVKVRNKPAKTNTSKKTKRNWSKLSLQLNMIVFVLWLLFIGIFGIVGGKNIPVIKSIYPNKTSASQEATKAPSADTTETTKPNSTK